MIRRLLWTAGLVALLGAAPRATAADDFATTVKPFLVANCVKCHGPEKPAGGIRVDDLTADTGKQVERWAAVREQVRDGTMPPAKEPKPAPAAARAVVAWVSGTIGVRPAPLPNQGNLVPHELLFGPTSPPAAPPTGRVWRLSPQAYRGWLLDLSRSRMPELTQPFTLVPERGIRDFATLYTIDEPATDILLRNAETIVNVQTGTLQQALGKKDAPVSSDAIPEFAKLVVAGATPTKAQLETAIKTQYRLAIGRVPSNDEVSRLIGLYEKCAASGDRPAAVKTMLQAVLLKTDALYRSELATGPGGRKMLEPHELVRALSLTLGERRELGLVAAAEKGQLTTREQVATHIRRILDDPKASKPRILRFFHEYFEYGNARSVFKENPKGFQVDPHVFVSDTDRLVLHILDADKDVLRELLTTPKSFVNYQIKKNKAGVEEPAQAKVYSFRPEKGETKPPGLEGLYGFEDFPKQQPVDIPGGVRLGILMQPSWLEAWSTNFENDPVRRGRWIRERLLGGTVPELPIGVAAQVPDEPHRTYRDRLTVTRAARCWTCHQKMDELGLPFEQFDHYGRYRTTETVIDPSKPPVKADPKTKTPAGPATIDTPIVTTGLIADSGDPILDGPVRDPRDLVRKLANSTLVRQVFVRHAFRYFLGRNESLADAKVLQEADRAYVESGGSFKALVVSLLSSDAFLYRSTAEGDRK